MKQKLKDSLANGKTKQVITELLTITKHNSDLYNQVIPLSARYTHYERQKFGGLDDSSVLNVELRQINVALLAIIEELDEKKTPTISEAVFTKKRLIWGSGSVVVVVGLFASIAQISGFSLKDFFKGEIKNTETKLETSIEKPRVKQTVPIPESSTQPLKPIPKDPSKHFVKIILTVDPEFEKGEIFVNDKRVFPISETPIFKELEIEYQPVITIVVKSGNQSCSASRTISQSDLNNQTQIRMTCTQ